MIASHFDHPRPSGLILVARCIARNILCLDVYSINRIAAAFCALSSKDLYCHAMPPKAGMHGKRTPDNFCGETHPCQAALIVAAAPVRTCESGWYR
jgi:hypothetical protein